MLTLQTAENILLFRGLAKCERKCERCERFSLAPSHFPVFAVALLFHNSLFDQLSQQEPDVLGSHACGCGDISGANRDASLLERVEDFLPFLRQPDGSGVTYDAPRASVGVELHPFLYLHEVAPAAEER